MMNFYEVYINDKLVADMLADTHMEVGNNVELEFNGRIIASFKGATVKTEGEEGDCTYRIDAAVKEVIKEEMPF